MRTCSQYLSYTFFILFICGFCYAPLTSADTKTDTAQARQKSLLDLSQAVVLSRPGPLAKAEKAAATVLIEEFQARTGIQLRRSTTWPQGKTVIAISAVDEVPAWGRDLPCREGGDGEEKKAEGYRLLVDPKGVVWILGADARGALYGVGAFLRQLNWTDALASLPTPLDITTAPAYPIRGHQLGYRGKANSWDAWTPEQFDQYIRELSFFGVNSIENIPALGASATPLMKMERHEMDRHISAICDRYGLDYWVWTPAVFDLSDTTLRSKALDTHEKMYRDCPTLSGVFFPGGDPGHNPAHLVMSFLEDLAKRLTPIHPEAQLWLSLQGFDWKQIRYVMDYLERESPDWLSGLVGGPSAPPIPMTRRMLPEKYQYRLYPDITHNKISQYPVPWWDQAYALTLGREAINPRPMHYAYIHNWFAPYTDGFISYSDGVHDDVNKTVWSSLAWDSQRAPRDILLSYCRVFFGPQLAESAADGILALENNWRGPLVSNGAVEGTLLYWQALEKENPQLQQNWRWQMCLVRAYYDAYTRRRLLNESRLETEANAILTQCETLGPDQAMREAMNVLQQAIEKPVAPDLKTRINRLCEMLFESIGLQTSVPKYGASGAERGAFLDFLDYPLNNRWWLEDEFEKVRSLPSTADQCKRLITLATWENPSEGSYYDDIGNPAKSSHVKRSEFVFTEPGEEAHPEPVLWWWDNGMSRARLSWQSSMNYPEAVVYEGLDPQAEYTVRCSGYGKFLLRINGERVDAPADHAEMGEVREFPVPPEALQKRKLELTWIKPNDEGHLNWRRHSRLSEVWLIKK